MRWKLKGRHKQETRSGKNKIPLSSAKTINGVNLSVDKKGIYTLSGTATSDCFFSIPLKSVLIADVSRTMSLQILDGTASTTGAFYLAFRIRNSSGVYGEAELRYKSDTSKYTTKTITTECATAEITVVSGTTLNNIKLAIQLEDGTEATSIEQYGMMPSTTYPSRIKTAGNNVNLFNYNDKKVVDELYTVDDEGWITCECDNSQGTAVKYLRYYTNNLKLKTNTQYAIFVEIKNISGTGRLSATSYYTDSQFAKTSDMYFSNLKSNDIYKFIVSTKDDFSQSLYGLRTLCIFQTGESGSITFRISVQEDTAITAQKFVYSDYNQRNIKIEKNNTDTSSDKYEEQTIVMPVQQEMLQGDYIEDVEHHEWGKYIFTGEETIGNIGKSGDITFFKISLSDLSDFNYIDDNTVNYMCTHFKAIKVADRFQNNTLFINIEKKVSLCSQEITTIDALKAYLKARYDANDPVVIYYKLANAIDLELTEAQKAVREQKLHTYKNITNINLSDELASIDVTYKKDLDTILNNLQAQIIANASEEVTE